MHQKIAIVQAHPLPPGDASGAVSFFVVMALIIGGYLSSTIAMAFGGPATRRRRLASLAIAAVIGALLTDTLAGPVLGAVPDVQVPGALGALHAHHDGRRVRDRRPADGARCRRHAGRGHRLRDLRSPGLGRHRAVGVPARRFWRTIGPYLPAGAGTTVVRNTIYFDGNRITTSLLVLAAYLVVGAVAVLLIPQRRPPSSAEAEAEASIAATAVV